MQPPVGPDRKPLSYEGSGPFDEQEIHSDVAQQVVQYQEGGDIDERWRNDLLRFVLYKHKNPDWKAEWWWDDAWLTTPSKFQPGRFEINYKAWFAELTKRRGNWYLYRLLKACHNFSISCDEVAAGPLKNLYFISFK